FFRASVETAKETLLDSYCRQHKTSSIACNSWRDTIEVDNYSAYFASRFDEIMEFAYDQTEHILSSIAGMFINFANKFFQPLPGKNSEILSSLGKEGLQAEVITRLMSIGVIGSLLQNSAWSMHTREALSAVPVILTSMVSAFVNGSTYNINFGGGFRGGIAYTAFNIGTWTLSTTFTRFGSATFDE